MKNQQKRSLKRIWFLLVVSFLRVTSPYARTDIWIQTPGLEGICANLDLLMRFVHFNIIRFGITAFWGKTHQIHRSLSIYSSPNAPRQILGLRNTQPSHVSSLVLGRSETPDDFESVAIAMFGTKLWLYCEVGRDVFSD